MSPVVKLGNKVKETGKDWVKTRHCSLITELSSSFWSASSDFTSSAPSAPSAAVN